MSVVMNRPLGGHGDAGSLHDRRHLCQAAAQHISQKEQTEMHEFGAARLPKASISGTKSPRRCPCSSISGAIWWDCAELFPLL
jgi:hypothetical protein